MILPAISLLDKLIHADQWLFVQLNSHWTNPVFDSLLPQWRAAEFWAPLYLFLLLFTIANFRTKGLWWVLFFLCTFVACDLTGTYAFKKVFERLRPCNDPDFYMHVRLLLDHCGSGFSFVSNHATNHFGLGVFSLITLRPVIGKWAWLGPLWAFSVALHRYMWEFIIRWMCSVAACSAPSLASALATFSISATDSLSSPINQTVSV